MQKFKFNAPEKSQQVEQEKTDSKLHGTCEVYGCPRDGHIYTNNWNCRYHHNQHGDKLHRITQALINNEFVVNWYERLINFTIVDFDLGDVAQKAPVGFFVKDGETFKEYKNRIHEHVYGLWGHYDRK